MKNLIIIILFFIAFFVNLANAALIEDIKVENNNRISKETIITYGDIKLNKDYNSNQINEILLI